MCQILCLTKHDPETRDKLIAAVWAHMAHVGNQHDGFGAAWYTPEGKIGYHKSRCPNFTYPHGIKDKVAKFCKKGFFDIESNGLPSDGGFLIIHGRNATCPISVENTHPMLAWGDDPDAPIAAMVHNGVVRSSKYKAKDTSCDSELLLQAYVAGGIKEVEKEIYGNYAFMHLALADGHKTLQIAKDSKAKLHCGTLPGDSWVFATTEGLIEKVKGEYLSEVLDNVTISFVQDDPDFTILPFAPQLAYGPTGTTPTPNEIWEANKAAAKAFRDHHHVHLHSYPPRTANADDELKAAIDDAVDKDKELAKLTPAFDDDDDRYGTDNWKYHAQ